MASSTGETALTPGEYLELASSGEVLAKCAGTAPVVTGSVNLSAHPLKDLVRILPRALIDGDLCATGCRFLEAVHCEVRGKIRIDDSAVRTLGPGFAAHSEFSANRCMNLAELSGFFPSTVELEESGVRRLPREFRCGGDLYLSSCGSLVSLDCTVSGSVFANRSSVELLGDNFSCLQELHLTGCPRLRTVPEVHGPPTSVYLAESGVERVSPSFACSGSLVLKDVACLRELSGRVGQSAVVANAPCLETVDGLSAGKSLSVSGSPSLRLVRFSTAGPASFHRCGMEELHDSSTASGELSIVDCGEFRQLGGEWRGDVTLVDLRALSRVRATFACDGDLTLRSCPDLVHLAGRVRGRANLAGLGGLEKIGPDFSVIGDMTMDAVDTRLRELGCLVGGNFRIANAPMLESSSPRFLVGLNATFRACPKFRVVRGRVCGDTELKQGTAIGKIGADFECGGNLLISNCPPVESVNCVVAGDLVLEHSSVRKRGPAFSCGGKVVLGPASSFPDDPSAQARAVPPQSPPRNPLPLGKTNPRHATRPAPLSH